MSDKYLLVPGTGGCKLLLDGKDIGWPAELVVQSWLSGLVGYALNIDLLDPDKIVDLLSMRFSEDTSQWEPEKTTLISGGRISAGPVLKAAYNQFPDYDVFEYDWRSDIRDSGRRLLEYIQANAPKKGRWKIVAHSQGGLVLVVASKLFAQKNNDDASAFSKLASHAAFMAVPLAGTVVAADALINGEQLTQPFSEQFKQVARTWPSLHQMLPSWKGSVHKNENGNTTVLSTNLLSEEPWTGRNIDSSMLKRAQETRKQFLRAPISRMNKVKVRIVMSQAWQTGSHVTDSTMNVSHNDERGDTLVPEETTRRSAGKEERACMHSIGNDKDTMKHSVVGTDPVITTDIKKFFKQ